MIKPVVSSIRKPIHPGSLTLFPTAISHRAFPTTRYQGSKLKLLDWIAMSIEHLDYDTALDLFGGTGSVGYLMKCNGKAVTFTDQLRSNFLVGKALIENATVLLSENDIQSVIAPKPQHHYDNFISRTFENIYFTAEENRWLDIVTQNIKQLRNPYKQALSYFALFQAAIAKRPYNLFHRANLYMRTSDVKRSFGNKATWEKPFEQHFRRAALQANNAVFDNERQNRAILTPALEAPTDVDLVYIDTPYMSAKGVSVDYLEFYHFLEGLCEYSEWPSRIDANYRHKPYRRRPSPWCDRQQIHQAFDDVFARFKESILVVSYRDNGIPTPQELVKLMKRHKQRVHEANNTHYKYVLSKTASRELLFIAE